MKLTNPDGRVDFRWHGLYRNDEGEWFCFQVVAGGLLSTHAGERASHYVAFFCSTASLDAAVPVAPVSGEVMSAKWLVEVAALGTVSTRREVLPVFCSTASLQQDQMPRTLDFCMHLNYELALRMGGKATPMFAQDMLHSVSDPSSLELVCEFNVRPTEEHERRPTDAETAVVQALPVSGMRH